MYNKALLSLVALLSFKAFAMEFTLDKSLVKSQRGIGEVSVIHSSDGFYTEYKGNKSKATIPTNSPLLNMDQKQIKALIKTGSYLTVEDMGNGQHKLELKSKVKGGGPLGATAGFWGGAFLVNSVCYGTIGLISGGIGLFCPPLGVVVGAGLSATLTAPIQVTATAVGLGCGVVGAVATGPV